MPRCINKATLLGYLGADPEIRTLQGGARVAHFSVATTQRWTDGEGEVREKTQWHRVVAWDSLPATFAFVQTYLRKGERVYVEGAVEYRSYEVDGVTRWVTEIRAAEVIASGESNRKDGGRTPVARDGGRARARTGRQVATL